MNVMKFNGLNKLIFKSKKRFYINTFNNYNFSNSISVINHDQIIENFERIKIIGKFNFF
jgi:hypothetical protein